MRTEFKRADELLKDNLNDDLLKKLERLDNEINELWKQTFRIQRSIAEIQARLTILKELLR